MRLVLRAPGPGSRAAVRRAWLLAGVVGLGLLFRLLAATRGSNGDMGAYWEVAVLAHEGRNVYACTPRYNYGPVWFHVLHGVFHLAAGDREVFRFVVAALLSFADVGIFLVLLPRFGALVAAGFLLNPVSILITGYHSQFDNLAILLGLLAVSLAGDGRHEESPLRRLAGISVLGLSLATKHVLFAFPLWLAARQRGLAWKAAALLLPPALFAGGFLPYWAAGREGVVRNVFLYASNQVEPMYRWLVPGLVRLFVPATAIWLIVLAASGVLLRRREGIESVLLYTAFLVASSPAIANQYLAIPVAFATAFASPFSVLYTAVATLHLLVDHDGLGLSALRPTGFGRDEAYARLVQFLVLGLLWALAAGSRTVARLRSPRGRAANPD